MIQTQAKEALKQLGWKPSIAAASVMAAAAAVGVNATLEQLIVEALRRCPLRASTTPPRIDPMSPRRG